MIYVNGDSWTSGWPQEEILGHRDNSWPHLLGLMIGEQVLNDAEAGCSNDRIYRRTFDFILKNKPTTAIVCLTSWLRFELGDTQSGRIYQYMPSNDNVKFYKKHWHPYLAYTNFLRQIISLQSICTETDIYFLDTVKNNLQREPTLHWFKEVLRLGGVFDTMDDERIEKKFDTIVNLNKHINYNLFISDKSYQELVSHCKMVEDHPIDDGHKVIANIIYTKIFKDKHHG